MLLEQVRSPGINNEQCAVILSDCENSRAPPQRREEISILSILLSSRQRGGGILLSQTGIKTYLIQTAEVTSCVDAE